MFIIADARLPAESLRSLRNFGQVFEFSGQGAVYDSIAGHPDIFLCPTPNGLIVAPNAPGDFLIELQSLGVQFAIGKNPVGKKYPETARYNAFVSENLLVHNFLYTEEAILHSCHNLIHLNVAQAYTRCNIAEANGLHITSDRGIEKALIGIGREVFFVQPENILLPGQRHGFVGGCMGFYDMQLFIAGSSAFFPEGNALKNAVQNRGVKWIELYQGPLFDGGSILFV